MKKEKGITLIALVIAIIVLLILAAVSIATLTGENGIFAKATKARADTDKAKAKEQVQIAVMASYNQDGKLNFNTVKKELEKIEGSGSITDNNGDFPVKVTVDSYPFEIDKDGNVTDGTDEGLKDKNEIGGGNTTGGGDTPTPPVVDEKWQIVTGENKEYENNGKAIIPVGFAVVPELDDVSEGLVISDVENDTENKGNQFVWVPVTSGTQYKRNTSFNGTGVSAIAKDDTDYLPEGITNEEQAVRKAGGFYIARYEAGKEGTDTLVIKKGSTVWVDMSQPEDKAKAKTMFTNNEKVKSALISGIQWDVTMAFINGKKDGLGNTYDVTKASSTRHVDSETVTGNNEADRVCNIYDLEGNYSEYIAELAQFTLNSPYSRRGGNCYNYSGNPIAASNRASANGDGGAFRIMLYVIS